MPFYTVFQSPVGDLYIGENASQITFIALQNRAHYQPKETPLLQSACLQLQSYFEGILHTFDLPLNPQGTVFQQKVCTH
jgi:methylated-DNA-[protein]-cysteine S-methyltransferase